MIVDLEPELLASLVRQQLTERGLVTVSAAQATERAPTTFTLALVSESLPEGVDAEVVVRLRESGAHLPTAVDVESGDPDTVRTVVLSSVDDLIDLLVALGGQ